MCALMLNVSAVFLSTASEDLRRSCRSHIDTAKYRYRMRCTSSHPNGEHAARGAGVK